MAQGVAAAFAVQAAIKQNQNWTGFGYGADDVCEQVQPMRMPCAFALAHNDFPSLRDGALPIAEADTPYRVTRFELGHIHTQYHLFWTDALLENPLQQWRKLRFDLAFAAFLPAFLCSFIGEFASPLAQVLCFDPH